MKKFFASVLALTIGATAFAADYDDVTKYNDYPFAAENGKTPTLVYDFRASVKRLDARYARKSWTKDDMKFSGKLTDMYRVASDSIQGYIVMPACVKCTNDPDTSVDTFYHDTKTQIRTPGDVNAFYPLFAYTGPYPSSRNPYAGNAFYTATDLLNYLTDPVGDDWYPPYTVGYFSRRGDRYYKKAFVNKDLEAGEKIANDKVYSTRVEIRAGIFGAFINASTLDDEGRWPFGSIKNANKAWMYVNFGLDDRYKHQIVKSSDVIKDSGNEPLNYAFWGFDNIKGGRVRATGFGTTKVTTSKDGFCNSSESCQIINTINGSLIAYDLEYLGPCLHTPMWDLCWNGHWKDNIPLDRHEAVACGTWSLRYNQALTNIGSFKNKEEAILKKLKVDGTNLRRLWWQPEFEDAQFEAGMTKKPQNSHVDADYFMFNVNK